MARARTVCVRARACVCLGMERRRRAPREAPLSTNKNHRVGSNTHTHTAEAAGLTLEPERLLSAAGRTHPCEQLVPVSVCVPQTEQFERPSEGGFKKNPLNLPSQFTGHYMQNHFIQTSCQHVKII